MPHSRKFQRGKMLTGTAPARARPVVMPICISSATGSSTSRAGSTPFKVLLIAVPGIATAWPMNTVRGSAARNSIDRFSSSKYFMGPASELHPHAGTRMRVVRRVAVVVDVVVADVLEAQARLVPGGARIGAHRLLVVFA